MHSLIIFASGTGTNAAAIIDWCRATGKAGVALVVCNKPGAGVLDIAARNGIPTLLVDRESFRSGEFVHTLKGYNPSLLVLAGFLWKVPEAVVAAFPGRIINIHPALLPAYGGKGMYGHHVHEAVIAAGEKSSGITIHYVNEHYDEGDIIVQAHCPVVPGDTPGTLAKRIHKLEHYYFPLTIGYLLANIEG